MKYHEAIDMILEGGRARKCTWINKDYYICFIDCGILSFSHHYPPRNSKPHIVVKDDILDTDWIVEKDGVVYEEYESSTKDTNDTNDTKTVCGDCANKEAISIHNIQCQESVCGNNYGNVQINWTLGNLIEFICTLCGRTQKVEAHYIVDCPKYKNNTSQGSYPQMKLRVKNIKIDEDWLEKKMLCFVRRLGIPGNPGVKESRYRAALGTCCDMDCPFCFPGENAIGKLSMLPTATAGQELCGKHGWSDTTIKIIAETNEEKHYCTICLAEKEQAREKVTIEQMVTLIDILFLQRKAANLDLMLSLGLSESERRFRMNDCRITFDEIKQKLEYLVNLQEKE